MIVRLKKLDGTERAITAHSDEVSIRKRTDLKSQSVFLISFPGDVLAREEVEPDDFEIQIHNHPSIVTSAVQTALRFSGMKEIAGEKDNPFIMFCLKLDNAWPQNDEVPWCSAFANFVAFTLGLERTKSLRARSWLTVGEKVDGTEFTGNEVVIFKRGKGEQPGPEVIDAPGHVAFLCKPVKANDTLIEVIGGNQSDSVKVSRYYKKNVLGFRRLRMDPTQKIRLAHTP